jgi:tetratricopeptide (TPR) repeat protein
MAAESKWLKEHLLEILLTALVTAIVSLLAFIGNEKLNSLDRTSRELRATVNANTVKLEETSCRINALSATDRVEDFETDFLGQPLYDLTLVSTPLQKLNSLQQFFSRLGHCKEMRSIVDQISHMHDGLDAYIGGDYDAAIQNFKALPPDEALTQQLLGSTYYRKSLLYDVKSPEYKQYRLEASNCSHQFRLLANQELGGLIKQAVIDRYVCNVESRRTSDSQASQEALACLSDLVRNNKADHNTFYNLADVTSRLGEFQEALQYLQRAAQADTQHQITQSFIRIDPDLSALSANPQYHSQWFSALALFPN